MSFHHRSSSVLSCNVSCAAVSDTSRPPCPLRGADSPWKERYRKLLLNASIACPMRREIPTRENAGRRRWRWGSGGWWSSSRWRRLAVLDVYASPPFPPRLTAKWGDDASPAAPAASREGLSLSRRRLRRSSGLSTLRGVPSLTAPPPPSRPSRPSRASLPSACFASSSRAGWPSGLGGQRGCRSLPPGTHVSTSVSCSMIGTPNSEVSSRSSVNRLQKTRLRISRSVEEVNVEG